MEKPIISNTQTLDLAQQLSRSLSLFWYIKTARFHLIPIRLVFRMHDKRVFVCFFRGCCRANTFPFRSIHRSVHPSAKHLGIRLSPTSNYRMRFTVQLLKNAHSSSPRSTNMIRRSTISFRFVFVFSLCLSLFHPLFIGHFN